MKRDKKTRVVRGKEIHEEKDVVIVTPVSGSEYYDEESLQEKERAESGRRRRSAGKSSKDKKEESKKMPKSRRIALGVLAALLIGLLASILWINRYNLNPTYISNWFQTKLLGIGIGDGYPVELTGSGASISNFVSYDGNCAVLSDTVLTVRNATGEEIISTRHSYDNPAMKVASGRFVIYNQGGEGYSVYTRERGAEKFVLDETVAVADIAENGNYGIVTYPNDYASVLEVYNIDHELLYTYKFSDGYATALDIRADGYMGAVATVYTNHGEIYSKVTVLDFTKESPVAEYTMNGDLVTTLHFGGSSVYAVGDTKISVSDSSFDFTDYSYEGKQLTAVTAVGARVYVAVSGYSYAGASTLMIFNGNTDPLTISLADRIEDISAYGSVTAVLAGDMVHSFDTISGVELGGAQAGSDAQAISLLSESSCYVMGAKEIRCVSIEK